MAGEKEEQTLVQKLLFYITAFFILLATFSLFAFLFLVPFVIDPAFTTIFMEFEEKPTTCITMDSKFLKGTSNCTWSSCREGCTKDVYNCTQIRVKYLKVGVRPEKVRTKRALRDYDYLQLEEEEDLTLTSSQSSNVSTWITGARLFPNVKGCGYPPILNCANFLKLYEGVGTNFSCYFSWVNDEHVISEFNLRQVYLNLVFAMAIPIPSFIISVIYLAFAYFVIYAEEPVSLALVEAVPTGTTPVPPPTSGALTPTSEVFREDLASFGHDLKMTMADEASRESVATCVDTVPHSNSIPDGSVNKISIATPPGPIAAV